MSVDEVYVVQNRPSTALKALKSRNVWSGWQYSSVGGITSACVSRIRHNAQLSQSVTASSMSM